MPKLKPLQIYLGLSLGVVAGAIVIGLSFKSSAPVVPKPTPQPLPSGISNPNSNLELTNLPPKTTAATTIPLYAIAPFNQAETIDLLSNTFGVKNPQQTTYPNGQTRHTWKDGLIELNYYPHENRINYYDPSILDSPQPLPNSLEDLAASFIDQYLYINKPLSISLISTTYLSSNTTVAKQVNSPSQANLIQYEYRYLLAGSPLYLEPYAQPDIVVVLNQNGIRNLKAKVAPQISPTPQTSKLIGQDQIPQLLSQNQFIIIKVNSSHYYEAAPLFDINKMTARSTNIGYIMQTTNLTPYYIISGTAPNTNNARISYQVEIAVRATDP